MSLLSRRLPSTGGDKMKENAFSEMWSVEDRDLHIVLWELKERELNPSSQYLGTFVEDVTLG